MRRPQARGHRKKTGGVVYGKKGKPKTAWQSAPVLPSQQRHTARHVPPRPQAAPNNRSAAGRLRKVNQATWQQPVHNQTAAYSDRNHDDSDNHLQALYRQNHRGYVLETRRQRKRRMALAGDSTALYARNFTHINCNCRGHYHLAESIDVDQGNATLPLCKESFQGTLKGAGHKLSIRGSQPLFETLQNTEIDLPLNYLLLEPPTERGASTALLANRLSGNNTICLSGGSTLTSEALHGMAVAGDVDFMGLTEDGHHDLKQIYFSMNTIKSGVTGGALSRIKGGQTTLTQTHCHLKFLNRLPVPPNGRLVVIGGGVAELTGGQLVLTQTNTRITELSGAGLNDLHIGGGIGRLSGDGCAVLTQTDVNTDLYTAADGATNSGATFGSIARNATVTLRLFSGYSSANVCGTIESDPAVTIKGVIDTTGYAANTASCQAGNHTHAALRLLDTSQVQDWIDAHSEFCCSQVQEISPISCPPNYNASCHYPHERVLATVAMADDSALLLSRQLYPYNAQRAKDGLLRVSRLQFNPTLGRRNAELNLSFGGNGTLLFKPGNHNAQLQPRRVLLAQAYDHNVTLLCTDDSDSNVYHVGTLPLQNNQTDNATVVMQRLEGLKGRPVLLTSDHNSQGGHLFTHEPKGHTVYRYCLNGSCERPVGNFSTEGPVIGVGIHNHTIYVASCNQSNDVIVQPVNPTSWELAQPIAVALLTSSIRSDDTLAINEGTLILVPQRTVLAKQGNKQLQTLRVNLPMLGGMAYWLASHTVGQQLNKKTCEPVTATTSEPTRPENESVSDPNKKTVIGLASALASVSCGLCCVAAVHAAAFCKRSRHGHKTYAEKAAPPLQHASNRRHCSGYGQATKERLGLTREGGTGGNTGDGPLTTTRAKNGRYNQRI